MKLAELIAQFIERQGVRYVFGVSGGASLHLIHGFDATQIAFIPTTHECNAGFAADAYARLTGFGCAVATSGPGATNLVTAIATSYYDSVPTLYLTGNVATARQSVPLSVRQYGFQDAPIVDLVQHITKAAIQLRDADDVLYQLQRLTWIAKEGRQGPVLLDIPDDLQRAEVTHPRQWKGATPITRPLPDVTEAVRLINTAQRPLLVLGAGARDQATAARALFERLPVVTTWGAIDCIPHSDPLMIGGFGTHGTRGANFAYANADLLICLGTRLDTKATGTLAHWAREAKVIMVDRDSVELHKFHQLGRPIDVPICDTVERFLDAVRHRGMRYPQAAWLQRCTEWKAKYTDAPRQLTGTDPYELIKQIAQHTTADDVIVTDTGCALGWTMQAFPFNGQRFVHALNMTPMGYGIPAAVGAALATGRRVVLITGDGSIMMSLPELATCRRWNLPIKILLLDNKGHAMCRQTQRQWLGGTYPATSLEGGLAFPHWWRCANSFGVPMAESLEELFSNDRLQFLHVDIDPDAQMIPQAKFGQPLEDADPQLPREEFLANMIVRPV